jgi:hypothetical protein
VEFLKSLDQELRIEMDMDTKVKKQLQNQPNEASANGGQDGFDFERWVREVKPQLIAALRRSSGQ